MPAPNYGWYVGGTDVDDWLLWKAPFFASGTYDVYIRYASSTACNLTLLMGGKTDNISLPSTSGVFQGKKIIASRSLSGTNDITMTIQTAGTQIDFLHFDRTDAVPVMYRADDPLPALSGIKISPYPNGVRIDYPAPFVNNHVDVRIFNLGGRLVWQYQTTQSGTGLHSVNWAAANNAPGAYVLNMKLTDNKGKVYSVNNDKFLYLQR